MKPVSQAINELYSAKLQDTKQSQIDCIFNQFAKQLQDGFTDHALDLSGQNASHCVLSAMNKALRLVPGITKLKLHGNLVRDTGLHKITSLLISNPQIDYLDLGSNDLSDSAVRILEEIISQNSIRTLNLGKHDNNHQPNRFSRDGLISIIKLLNEKSIIEKFGMAGLNGKRHMQTYKAKNFSSNLANLIVNCHHLSTLDISDAGLNDLDQSILSSAFSVSKAIRYLDISFNSFPSNHIIIDGITKIRTLRYLDISHCELNETAGYVIAHSLNTTMNIISLNLSHNPLGSQAIEAILTQLADNITVVTLNISNTGFDSTLVPSLKLVFKQNRVLNEIDLSCNILQDSVAEIFVPEMTVQKISLASCRITDVGGIQIAEGIVNNKELHYLSLRDNFLTRDSGFKILDIIKHNEAIKMLDLSSNQIDQFALSTVHDLCERNKATKRAQKLDQLRKEYIALSIQSAKLPGVEKTLNELSEKYNELSEDVARLDSKIEFVNQSIESATNQSQKAEQEFVNMINSEESHIVELQETLTSLQATSQRTEKETRSKIEFEKKEIERLEAESAKIEAALPAFNEKTEKEKEDLENEIVRLQEMIEEVTRVMHNKKKLRDYKIPDYPYPEELEENQKKLTVDELAAQMAREMGLNSDGEEQDVEKKKKKGRKKKKK